MVNLKASAGSRALVMASVYTGIVHLILGILGTFVLKRFPTSFSVGFFMGVLVILANQNFLLTGTFFRCPHGNPQTNQVFANFCFCLFLVLAFFSLMLFHFKEEIVVAPIDTKHHNSQKQQQQRHNNSSNNKQYITDDDVSQQEHDHSTAYSQYTEYTENQS